MVQAGRAGSDAPPCQAASLVGAQPGHTGGGQGRAGARLAWPGPRPASLDCAWLEAGQSVSHTRSARQGPLLAAARRVMVMFRLSNICNTSLG